jgi:LuxR family maltose regulon positive regulatory protein
MLYHEMGKDDLRDEHMQKASERGEQTTLVDWAYRWHVAQVRIEESEGELETALALLEKARRAYVKTPIPDTRPVDALKANLHLKQGRLEKAIDWVRKRGLSADDALNYLNEYEHLVLARVLVAEYQSRQKHNAILQAIGLLERLLEAAEAQRRTGSVIEILVGQALAYQVQGALPQALASLERAVTLAEPEGYVRLFVDEGEPMQSLVAGLRLRMGKKETDQELILAGYVDQLLAAFAQPEAGLKSTIGEQTSAANAPSLRSGARAAVLSQKSTMIEPLSEREQQVLKLLRSELSGPEIASHLVISPNTFRTHTRNIFAKLGVNNRRAAVRRAEELDLF